MALKLGFGDVALRVGATAATKAYLGTTQVWPVASPPVTVYTQDWATVGLNNWRAQAGSSAGSLAHDTARYASGALRWSASAASSAAVEHAGEIAVTAGMVLTVTARVSHNAAAARSFFLSAVAFAGDYSTQTNFASAGQNVATGTTATTLTYTFTVPASRTLLGFSVGSSGPASGEQMWLDDIAITRPGP